jgi:hypothetical protein
MLPYRFGVYATPPRKILRPNRHSVRLDLSADGGAPPGRFPAYRGGERGDCAISQRRSGSGVTVRWAPRVGPAPAFLSTPGQGGGGEGTHPGEREWRACSTCEKA